MRPDIAEFDLDATTADDLHDYYELRRAVIAADQPEDPPPSYDSVVGRLRTPLSGWGSCRHWVARAGGRVVGFATVGFPAPVNAHQGRTEIIVHPDLRRRGIGTELLRTVVPAIRSDSRSVVEGWAVTGSAGAAWATAVGFRAVHETVLQRLVLADLDRAAVNTEPPPGYQLRRWQGRTSEGLIDSYARTRSGIGDAPRGEATDQGAEWSAERVRAAEGDLLASGVEHRVVVAVHGSSGAVVAMTEVDIYPHRPEFGYQGDTVVLEAYRGHRLGHRIKSAMLDWLRTERPGLEHIYTSSAATNVHMLRLNEEIGFTVFRGAIEFEQDAGTVEAALARR